MLQVVDDDILASMHMAFESSTNLSPNLGNVWTSIEMPYA